MSSPDAQISIPPQTDVTDTVARPGFGMHAGDLNSSLLLPQQALLPTESFSQTHVPLLVGILHLFSYSTSMKL